MPVKIDFKFVIMKREIILTQDGSHTINFCEWNATYHSKYGAIQESMHVYINAGLKQLLNRRSLIKVFEMGFGTGLNVLLTLREAEINQQRIYYETIEQFPLEKMLFEKLNYCEQLQRMDLKPAFEQLHYCEWNKEINISPFFTFKKMHTPVQNYEFGQKINIIYYDAFSPAAQPELWAKEIFEKLFANLQPQGLLLTYCSKGDVRRAMQTTGFITEKLPGPPHKREILRAIKK
jgi:tRNA U34 5-methylaminomethyl-2-thiouridine-forming methyltransferase MnmC